MIDLDKISDLIAKSREQNVHDKVFECNEKILSELRNNFETLTVYVNKDIIIDSLFGIEIRINNCLKEGQLRIVPKDKILEMLIPTMLSINI